jgi:hypothetical protein
MVVRLAVYDESGAILDLTDHASLNLAYMPVSRTVDAIASKTATIEDATFTEAQFLAGTHYHAEFTFSETDMNPSLGSALSVEYWLVAFGIKTSGGGEVTHGGGTLIVEEDGTDNTVDPPDAPAVGITSAQASALIDAAIAALAYLTDLVDDTSPQLGGVLDANAKQIREAKGADVASATSLALGNDGNYFSVTGTTTITSIATKAVGTRVTLRFAGILTLTHHSTDLILPTGANITTAAGDVAVFREYATGDWVCESYQRASGLALANPSTGIANVVDDTTPQLGGFLDANANQIREAKGADVASATSLSLGNDGNYFSVTGTTTITSIGTKAVGTRVTLRFAGILTLTHHATDLILPTGANITTAAGDVAVFREYATGDWVCESYQRASGQALAVAAISVSGAPTSSNAVTSDANIDSVTASGEIILVDPGSGAVVLTLRPQASYSYAAGFHFWVVATNNANTVTISRGASVVLVDGTSDANLTLTAGVVYHIWRDSSNSWRVISKS